MIEECVNRLAYGDSVGFTPRLQACQCARLHEADKPHLWQAIGSRRHLRSLTARQRTNAPMLKRQSAAFKSSRVMRPPSRKTLSIGQREFAGLLQCESGKPNVRPNIPPALQRPFG